MKEVILSEEEWNRLASITSKEKEKAMNFLARWIHHEIIKRGFNLEVGPFSRAARGGYAVDVICDECEEALLCGEVHWKSDQELKWVLVDIRTWNWARFMWSSLRKTLPNPCGRRSGN